MDRQAPKKIKAARKWTPSPLTLILLSLIAWLWFRPPADVSDENRAPPPWQVTLPDGRLLSSDTLKGKVVLVNFWATDCTVCLREMPAMIETHRSFQARGFEAVFVAMPHDRPDRVLHYARRNALPFKVVLDVQGEMAGTWGGFSGARFKFGQADYRHVELEGGAPGTTFTNRGFDSRIELRHENLGGLAGVWGAQAGRSDFAALGEEAFLPESLTRTAAIFAFEERKIGALTPQFGARYERANAVLGEDPRGFAPSTSPL
jgi:peroxiredoxin